MPLTGIFCMDLSGFRSGRLRLGGWRLAYVGKCGQHVWRNARHTGCPNINRKKILTHRHAPFSICQSENTKYFFTKSAVYFIIIGVLNVIPRVSGLIHGVWILSWLEKMTTLSVRRWGTETIVRTVWMKRFIKLSKKMTCMRARKYLPISTTNPFSVST